jgi:uncharacterized protein YbjT (DUF2867 family)
MSDRKTQVGHSASHRPTVLVLGGYGFIGRYTVEALNRLGASLLIGTRALPRHPARGAGASRKRGERFSRQHRKAERRINFRAMRNADDWYAVLDGVDAVINCVGIMRERPGGTFQAVHNRAVGTLADACFHSGIPLVHMSALGLVHAVNPYTQSKLLGEQAILNSGAQAYIVRSSVVDAEDGYGAGWFYKLAQWPVWFLPQRARYCLSPVKAADLGEALALLALRALKDRRRCGTLMTKILEVGCGEWFTLESYLMRLRGEHALVRRPWVIRVPQRLARAIAWLCDWLDITAYSIGHHELLEQDNVPGVNHLPYILGRDPLPLTSAGKGDSNRVAKWSHHGKQEASH